MLWYYVFSTKNLPISFSKRTCASLFLCFQNWNETVVLQLTTKTHRNRNTQHYGVTPFKRMSVLHHIHPRSQYQECMSPPTNLNPEECDNGYNSYISLIPVFCLLQNYKRLTKLCSLVSCIVKFSSIIQIYYSTLKFIFILIHSCIKIFYQ